MIMVLIVDNWFGLQMELQSGNKVSIFIFIYVTEAVFERTVCRQVPTYPLQHHDSHTEIDIKSSNKPTNLFIYFWISRFTHILYTGFEPQLYVELGKYLSK